LVTIAEKLTTGTYVTVVTMETRMSVTIVIKGKAITVQGWTGPEGSRSLRLQDFKTIGTWC